MEVERFTLSEVGSHDAITCTGPWYSAWDIAATPEKLCFSLASVFIETIDPSVVLVANTPGFGILQAALG